MKGYIKSENYCTMSPDGLFGVRFNYSCYIHDRQYRNEVKIRKTRKEADLNFRNMIYDHFKKTNKKFLGFIVSRVYYYSVRLFARKAWVGN